jgi:predicted transcriptional regulator
MSEFSRWLALMAQRRGMAFSQREAADMLGLSLRQVQVYVSGRSQHTGAPVDIPYAVRCLMYQLVRGEHPQPFIVILDD